jgi:hypothetical protein
MDPCGQFDPGSDCLTQHGAKISIALINSCPGKICLVPPGRIACGKRAPARQTNEIEPGMPAIASACPRTTNTRHAAIVGLFPNEIATFPNAIAKKKFPG